MRYLRSVKDKTTMKKGKAKRNELRQSNVFLKAKPKYHESYHLPFFKMCSGQLNIY